MTKRHRPVRLVGALCSQPSTIPAISLNKCFYSEIILAVLVWVWECSEDWFLLLELFLEDLTMALERRKLVKKNTWIIYTMITSSYPTDHQSSTLSSLIIHNLWFIVNCSGQEDFILGLQRQLNITTSLHKCVLGDTSFPWMSWLLDVIKVW